MTLRERLLEHKQMEDYDRGISSIREARVPLEYTGEDQSVRNINAIARPKFYKNAVPFFKNPVHKKILKSLRRT